MIDYFICLYWLFMHCIINITYYKTYHTQKNVDIWTGSLLSIFLMLLYFFTHNIGIKNYFNCCYVKQVILILKVRGLTLTIKCICFDWASKQNLYWTSYKFWFFNRSLRDIDNIVSPLAWLTHVIGLLLLYYALSSYCLLFSGREGRGNGQWIALAPKNLTFWLEIFEYWVIMSNHDGSKQVVFIPE